MEASRVFGWIDKVWTYFSLKTYSEVHFADKDLDGTYDVLRQVECGQDVSDTLYVKEGHGPAQSVDSVVKVVEDDFFRNYNTETLREAITVR